MVYHINHFDPNSKEIEKELSKIPLCPGTCIFIDIVNSTNIKYTTSIAQWGKKLNNTFNFISILNDFPDNIVKGMGDELMVYIPDDSLKSRQARENHYSLLEEIYSTLFNISNFPADGLFLNCKAAIHYCTDVYNITFLKGFNDYYGKDIDLTARLMTKARENRIVFSEKFYKKVRQDLKRMGLNRKETCIKGVSGKYLEDFKGVPSPTAFRYIDVRDQ